MNGTPDEAPGATPADDPIGETPAQILRRFGPLHREILRALGAAMASGAPVTRERLMVRLRNLGYATSDYELGLRVNDLKRLGVVRETPSGELELESYYPVLGEVS